jgi:uncharacterized damage-inducible protein DinB
MNVNRFVIIATLLCMACLGSAVCAQTPNPMSTEVKGSYTNIKNNVLKAADKVSEADYGYKATPDVQSFGQRVAHISDANLRTCAALKGEQKTGSASSKTSKADIVAALKESYAYCDGVYDSMTDAEAVKLITLGRNQRSKISALWGLVAHDNEVYGAMGVYMRLKGIVPPSSER